VVAARTIQNGIFRPETTVLGEEIAVPLSDPIDILLAHDRWATREVLRACEKLSSDEWTRGFEMGQGSLQKVLGHVVWVLVVWTDTLDGRGGTPYPKEYEVGMPASELLARHAKAADELEAAARKYPVEGVIHRMREGKTITHTRGAVITHVATHGVHHRAQCLNMLRHLGVVPLPMVSVAEWSRHENAPEA
jgi:uncharacterized damage-inducible protein DinB